MTHDPSRHYTLDELERHPPRPAVDARVQAKTFVDLMRMAPPALIVNPPALTDVDNRASAWANAITPPDPRAVATARLAQIDAEAAALRAQLS